ncbi:uncharacterized protein RMCC_4894 [Mycolicibacterium canariasense]|uniref:SnoaL-like domain-containing protein n=1 Tax=Mycolicibacterium canariasense TaxID=228230 RepID=A0A100WHD9_MYCCR|nr:nuclear transport factor 2 family protein [Mycolicibacterium canariasense]MCV7212498.1 nuclear transport factor 2 family protein [Mycolicibacterium canariasense]ORV15453.1 hypothetical protein AWB94_03500 [Mycolicibacterium canariasense]GAS97929.1 uncharacterized protein RMCC_4894 [Mycolicibacterium canariasense]
MSTHDFVTRFAEFWRHPSPEQLPGLLHPDVVLRQPLTPTTAGIAAAQDQFRLFCHCLPGLHGVVDRWSGDESLVFIEFRLRAFGGTLEWPTVNRLSLRDGKATERVTYFDSLALLPSLLRHPSVGWRFATTVVRRHPSRPRHPARCP